MQDQTTATLVLTVIVMTAGVSIFCRWRFSPQRHIMKLLRRIQEEQKLELPVRTNHDHEIIVIPDGFTITTLNAPVREIVTVSWDAVTDATAYKRDLWSTDQVCIAFNLLDGTVTEAHEEMKGWLDLCSAMPECLPGAPRWEEWFMNITTPAFEANMTPLFHRSPPSVTS